MTTELEDFDIFEEDDFMKCDTLCDITYRLKTLVL